MAAYLAKRIGHAVLALFMVLLFTFSVPYFHSSPSMAPTHLCYGHGYCLGP